MLNRRHAYEKIKALIINGQVEVDQPLSERGLAGHLNMGRMPVREALKELASEGIVRSYQGRGTFIRQLTLLEVRDIFETRQGLEGIAARLASLRGLTPELQHLGAQMREIDQKSDAEFQRAKQIGIEFHRELVNASQNQQLVSIYNSLHAQIELSWRPTLQYRPVQSRKSNREHIAILACVENANPEQAERLMRQHLADALTVRVKVMGNVKAA